MAASTRSAATAEPAPLRGRAPALYAQPELCSGGGACAELSAVLDTSGPASLTTEGPPSTRQALAIAPPSQAPNV
jgi:hypothetical protein